MAENSTTVNGILKDLNSTKVAEVLAAIKLNRTEGNAKTFKALLNVLKDTDEPTVEAAIIEFLYDLKDEQSIPILLQAIEDKEFEFYRSFLIAAFWQSAIDGSPYIQQFISAAIHGDYMTCLEALTVIENFDSAFSQDELTEYESDLILAAEEEEDTDKKELLLSMADVVRNLPIEGE